ncbi:DUF1173 family protein [Pantoea agglomerans]|uniref:DUF1173 family protein n=1 Tax=Enterobacter agglomerans TaxID=549 RepID=UPI001F5BC48B|nr:DUF1173 family protein [Pantoea agglomerans]
MRLLGLLHLLWELSGINVWHPGFDRKKRYPGWISWRLNETAARVRIGQVPLQQSLMLMLMAMKDSPQVAQNRLIAKDAGRALRRLILISQLAAWIIRRVLLRFQFRGHLTWVDKTGMPLC